MRKIHPIDQNQERSLRFFSEIRKISRKFLYTILLNSSIFPRAEQQSRESSFPLIVTSFTSNASNESEMNSVMGFQEAEIARSIIDDDRGE